MHRNGDHPAFYELGMPHLIRSTVMFGERRTENGEKKRHKPKEIVQMLLQVDVLVGQGMQRVEVA